MCGCDICQRAHAPTRLTSCLRCSPPRAARTAATATCNAPHHGRRCRGKLACQRSSRRARPMPRAELRAPGSQRNMATEDWEGPAPRGERLRPRIAARAPLGRPGTAWAALGRRPHLCHGSRDVRPDDPSTPAPRGAQVPRQQWAAWWAALSMSPRPRPPPQSTSIGRENGWNLFGLHNTLMAAAGISAAHRRH